MHLEDVSDIMHERKHAHGKEADSIKCEERSDDELLGADIFQKTEDTIDSNNQFNDSLPGELLSVVALGLFLGTAALRGADKATLAPDNGRENGTGVAHRDAHAKGHQNRQAQQADLPAGVAGTALSHKVKYRRSDCGKEDKAETDGVSPARQVSHRLKEGEQGPCAEGGK